MFSLEKINLLIFLAIGLGSVFASGAVAIWKAATVRKNDHIKIKDEYSQAIKTAVDGLEKSLKENFENDKRNFEHLRKENESSSNRLENKIDKKTDQVHERVSKVDGEQVALYKFLTVVVLAIVILIKI